MSPPHAGARGVAVEALCQLDQGHSGERWLRQQGLPGLEDSRDRAHALALYQGAARRRKALDRILSAASSRSLDRLDPWVRNALRVGIIERVELDRVPLHATVHTLVEGVKRHVGKGAAGFVNGVLRGLERSGGYALSDPGLADLPPWIAQDWRRDLGEEGAAARAAALLRAAPLCLRIRPGATDEERSLGEALTPGHPELRLNTEGNPTAVPGFGGDGWAVQDGGAALVAGLLGVAPGDRVVDLCAAPGGKSVLFADAAGPDGAVLAVDRELGRLGSFPRGGGAAAPIEALEATVEELSGATLAGRGFGNPTRIFLDAPCTALGTLRRHPEILWLRQRQDASRMARRQLGMLRQAAKLLGSGGRLVYAVCSPDRREGLEVVRQFISETNDLRIVSAEPREPGDLLTAGELGLWRTLPERGPVDAFVAAVLERR